MNRQIIEQQIKDLIEESDSYRERIEIEAYAGSPLEIMYMAKRVLFAEKRIETLQAELSILEAETIALS